MWGDWKETPGCSVSCGNGTKNMTRSKITIEQYGGSCSDQTNATTKACKQIPCPGKTVTTILGDGYTFNLISLTHILIIILIYVFIVV